MGKKGGDFEAPAIPRRGNAKAYRCRAEFTYRILETSKKFGPGLVITSEEYQELVKKDFVRPGVFEPVESEGEA
ncbi:MAG TPA: hypothetical protein VEK15_08150 [Vicinamibacteria bacterium]|nr:hypothetical protein [Vicinamibacteria bacterium]